MSVFQKKANLSSYIEKNEKIILPHWEDKELKRKTGISDLFSQKVKIKNDLTYEDACDCLFRASKMLDMANYVQNELRNKINSPNFKKISVKEQCQCFEAASLRDWFVKANSQCDETYVVCPVNTPEAIQVLKIRLKELSTKKTELFCDVRMLAMGTGVFFSSYFEK